MMTIPFSSRPTFSECFSHDARTLTLSCTTRYRGRVWAAWARIQPFVLFRVLIFKRFVP